MLHARGHVERNPARIESRRQHRIGRSDVIRPRAGSSSCGPGHAALAIEPCGLGFDPQLRQRIQLQRIGIVLFIQFKFRGLNDCPVGHCAAIRLEDREAHKRRVVRAVQNERSSGTIYRRSGKVIQIGVAGPCVPGQPALQCRRSEWSVHCQDHACRRRHPSSVVYGNCDDFVGPNECRCPGKRVGANCRLPELHAIQVILDTGDAAVRIGRRRREIHRDSRRDRRPGCGRGNGHRGECVPGRIRLNPGGWFVDPDMALVDVFQPDEHVVKRRIPPLAQDACAAGIAWGCRWRRRCRLRDCPARHRVARNRGMQHPHRGGAAPDRKRKAHGVVLQCAVLNIEALRSKPGLKGCDRGFDLNALVKVIDAGRGQIPEQKWNGVGTSTNK